MRLNKILKLGGVEKSVMIDFFVRLFDPKLSGFVSGENFERKVDELFGSGESIKKAHPDGRDPRKIDTVANNIKNICLANQVYELERLFDPAALQSVLMDNKIDLEIFKQALN